MSNLARDKRLAERWSEAMGGLDPASIEPGQRDGSGEFVPIRVQIKQALGAQREGGVS